MKLFTVAASAVALAVSASAMIIEPVQDVEVLAARTETPCVDKDDVWAYIAIDGNKKKTCKAYKAQCRKDAKTKDPFEMYCYQPKEKTGLPASFVMANCLKLTQSGKLRVISEQVASHAGLHKPDGKDWRVETFKICKPKHSV